MRKAAGAGVGVGCVIKGGTVKGGSMRGTVSSHAPPERRGAKPSVLPSRSTGGKLGGPIGGGAWTSRLPPSFSPGSFMFFCYKVQGFRVLISSPSPSRRHLKP